MQQQWQPYPQACEEWEEDLAKFHPDDLTPERKADLEAHLNVCQKCARVRADYLYHMMLIRRMVDSDYE